MFCRKCGTENTKGSRFCNKCGSPLSMEKNEIPKMAHGFKGSLATYLDEDIVKSTTGKTDKIVNTIESKPKKKLEEYYPSVAAIIILIIVLICVKNSNNNDNTIDFNKYLELEAIGYDGYGNVIATIDWDKFEEEYRSNLWVEHLAVVTPDTSDEHAYDYLLYDAYLSYVKDCISVNLLDNYNLSNGDEISYTWNVDEDSLKSVNYKFKFKDGKYKVSGLSEG